MSPELKKSRSIEWIYSTTTQANSIRWNDGGYSRATGVRDTVKHQSVIGTDYQPIVVYWRFPSTIV